MKSKTNVERVVDERGGLKMKPKHMFSYLLFAACMLICAAEMASAASITYVGSQMDIEDDADTPTDGWRNTTPAKPLDIDGNDILGTDGYLIYNNIKSNPSYATVSVVAPNNNGGSWGLWDNPSDPSGSDISGGGAYHDAGAGIGDTSVALLRFVISGSDLDGKILRVGILFDVVGGTGTAEYILSQTIGGAATAKTPEHYYDAASLDVGFFDIEGAVDGDTFDVTVHTISAEGYGAGFEQVGGITFDSIVPPPPAGTVVVIR